MNLNGINVGVLARLFIEVSDKYLEVKFIVRNTFLVHKRDAEGVFCKPRRVG